MNFSTSHVVKFGSEHYFVTWLGKTELRDKWSVLKNSISCCHTYVRRWHHQFRSQYRCPDSGEQKGQMEQQQTQAVAAGTQHGMHASPMASLSQFLSMRWSDFICPITGSTPCLRLSTSRCAFVNSLILPGWMISDSSCSLAR